MGNCSSTNKKKKKEKEIQEEEKKEPEQINLRKCLKLNVSALEKLKIDFNKIKEERKKFEELNLKRNKNRLTTEASQSKPKSKRMPSLPDEILKINPQKQEEINLRIVNKILKESYMKVDPSKDIRLKPKTEGSIFLKTLQIIEQAKPQEKSNALEEIVNRLEEASTYISPSPLLNSIIMNKTAKELKKSLINASPQFLETTDSSEMSDIFRQIEIRTGCDLVTGSQTEMIKFKIDSPELSESKVGQNNHIEIAEAMMKDIANFHRISKDQICIRYITKGSIEVLLSFPEMGKPKKIDRSHDKIT